MARAGVALVRGLPEPPANVSVSPRDGGATITYDPSPYTGGEAVTTYTVTANPGNHVVSGPSPIQVNGLTNGTEYTFTMTATTSVGVSQPSAPSVATPAVAPTAPAPPTGVVGTSGNGQVSVASRPGIQRRLAGHGLHRDRAAGEHHRRRHG